MNLKSFSSTASSSQEVMADIVARLGDEVPALMLIYMTVTMPISEILNLISQKYPTTKVAGTTSCNGVMTDEGFRSEDSRALGGMAFYSVKSHYGVGAVALKDGVIDVALACERSLASAGKSGILPTLVWMLASPGTEEICLEGMKKYFGTFVPVFGGSSADNDISGKWKLFINGTIQDSGLIIVSFFDIPEPHFSFHCGYQQTEFKGKVTKAAGRELTEIDNRPAALVYNEWTGGIVTEQLKNLSKTKSTNILFLSSLNPLARVGGEVGSFPYYLLSHPEAINQNQSMNLFTNIKAGEDVYLMEGSIESLQKRAAEVVRSLLERERISDENIAGALVIFCAGCMLTISAMSSMAPVVDGIKASLGEHPFLGAFTFGEQGCFFGENNFHGNLMISVTVFTKE